MTTKPIKPDKTTNQIHSPSRRRAVRTHSSTGQKAEEIDRGSESVSASPLGSVPEPGSSGKKLPIAQLEKICHRLGRSLKAGISFAKAWDNEKRFVKGPLRDTFKQVQLEIASGGTAADAVQKHDCFPPLFAELVRVGEETGRLDQAFRRLADHYRNLVRMRRTFQQSMTWPVLQLIGAAIAMTMFFLIIARLESTMALFKAPDIFTLGLSPIGNLMMCWGVIGLTCAGSFVAVKGTVLGWYGQLPMRLALRIPLLGNAIKTLSLSRFAFSLGTAVESGIDAKSAIRLGVRSTQNHYYTSHENAIAESIRKGNEFCTALRQTKAFPVDLLQAVQVGELTGDLPESLERLSDDYREQAELSLRKISQISSFSIFVLVTAMIGSAVILMYANYLGVLNEAMNSPMGTVEQIRKGVKSSNPVIAARNEAVKNFVENNEDFKKVQTVYENLPNINKMTPNEFLDGF